MLGRYDCAFGFDVFEEISGAEVGDLHGQNSRKQGNLDPHGGWFVI
jgi:hypothetical protein